MIRQTILLIILLLSISQCRKSTMQTSHCETQNLGIDTLNRYTYPRFNENIVTWPWEWNTWNDTIEISGYTGYYYVKFFFKKKDNCVDFLLMKIVEYPDTVTLDADTGETLTPEVYVENLYPVNYKLQEYIPDSLLVFLADQYKVWIDLIPENRNENLHDYNLQTH